MPISANVLNQLHHNNQSFIELSFFDQHLNDEDVIQLATILQKKNALIALNLTKNRVTAVGVIALSKLPLVSLDLSFNSIGDAGAIELFKNSTIPNLTLVNCNISDDGMRYLSTNKSIKYLNISYNPISYKILPYIEKNNTIEKIIVNNPNNNTSLNYKFFLFSINKHLTENKERLNPGICELSLQR